MFPEVFPERDAFIQFLAAEGARGRGNPACRAGDAHHEPVVEWQTAAQRQRLCGPAIAAAKRLRGRPVLQQSHVRLRAAATP